MIFNQNGIIDDEQLQFMLETYYNSTGISVKYVDATGKTVLKICDEISFCSMFHSITNGGRICEQTHLYAGKQSHSLGESFIFFCPAGLTEFCYPIIFEGIFQGTLVGGPILMSYPDDLLVDELLEKNQLDISYKSKLHPYLRSVPVTDPKRVRHLSNLLQILGDQLMGQNQIEMQVLYSRKELQKQIHKSLLNFKNEGVISSQYPYEKEKELLIRVRSGDSSGARAVLNDLLGYIFFDTYADIEVSKSRALEICSLISRAAIEGGADLNLMFGMNYHFIQDLSQIHTMDDLSYWMMQVLDRFTEHVILVMDSEHPTAIREALKYINTHYSQRITLRETAEIAGLSPKYLSSIFKKDTGSSFTEYINNLRINEAKCLLSTTTLTVFDIALSTGFEDQSYFTKVFKKATHLTPLQYRKTTDK